MPRKRGGHTHAQQAQQPRDGQERVQPQQHAQQPHAQQHQDSQERDSADAAAKQRGRNAKKAAKRAVKRAERREQQQQQQEEEEAAAARYAEYVSVAEARHQAAQEANDPGSRSNQLRTAANKLYGNLEGLAPVLLGSHIVRIESGYADALSAATTPLERCAAAKNAAVMAKRKLLLLKLDGPAALKLQAEALRHYVSALLWGAECQTIAWVDGTYSATLQLLEDAQRWRYCDTTRDRSYLTERWPEQAEVLSKLHASLPLDSSSVERSPHVAAIRASLSMMLGKNLYGEALHMQQAGRTEQQWRRALDLVGRVQPLFAMAAHCARQAGDHDIAEEADSLAESTDVCEAMCRSVQARHQADVMLRAVLADNEALEVESLRVVADLYKEAITIARDYDLESEARAHVALGRLYYNILRMTERGLAHYRQVLELGVAMMPRVVSDTDWYQEARAAVLKAQQEQAAADERAAAEQRAPYLEELAEEFKALRAAAEKGAHVLLQHIYKHHPMPGAQPSQLPKEAVMGDHIKDTLRKAVITYHPDKQVRHPRRWQVLAEEITKELNVKYQGMK